MDNGVIRKSGAWFTYGTDQLGQGKENARQFLKDNPELADEIENKILGILGIGEAGRKAKEAAAAAEAEAALEAAAEPRGKAPAKSTGRGSAKGGSSARGGSAKNPKKTAEALDIDTAFGEDAGGF